MAEAEYPELLEDMIEQVRSTLVRHGIQQPMAQTVARECAETIRQHWGGQQIYVPKGDRYDLIQRDAEIYKQFDGANYGALAHQFDLSEMQIRRIVLAARRAARERNQLALFPLKAS